MKARSIFFALVACQVKFASADSLGARTLTERFSQLLPSMTKGNDNSFFVVYDDSTDMTDKFETVPGTVHMFHVIPVLTVVNMTEETLIMLESDPEVVSIHENLPAIHHKEPFNDTAAPRHYSQRSNPNELNVGLDRIDQKDLPLDKEYNSEYTGLGVTVFIMDSGTRLSHVEFTGRATCGLDNMMEEGESCEDFYGHGTFVAGMVGGNTVGVAKDAQLVAIKVGTRRIVPSVDTMLRGLDYIADQKRSSLVTPMVAVFSATLPQSDVLERAVQNIIDMGVTFVTSAGSFGGRNDCVFSPNRMVDVINVGESARNDTVPPHANVGECVDLHAPGEGLWGPFLKNNTSYIAASGSSFSAPLVAGVAALYLEQDPTLTPAEVKAAILGDALPGILTGNIAGPNRLLYMGEMSQDEPECPFSGFLAFFCSFSLFHFFSFW